MKRLKRFLDLLPLLLIWLMASVLLWGWVFTFLTDTAPEKKIVLYVDAPVPRATELSVALEDAALSPAIEMVRAHPFTYAMMADSGLKTADLYIVRASGAEKYRDWFRPLPKDFQEAGTLLEMDGVPMGLRVYDQASGTGVAASYITYAAPQGPGEDCYLFFGRDSVHADAQSGADALALDYAQYLLTLP